MQTCSKHADMQGICRYAVNMTCKKLEKCMDSMQKCNLVKDAVKANSALFHWPGTYCIVQQNWINTIHLAEWTKQGVQSYYNNGGYTCILYMWIKNMYFREIVQYIIQINFSLMRVEFCIKFNRPLCMTCYCLGVT